MRKLLFIPIVFLFFAACSPDSDEQEISNLNSIENFELVVASLENSLVIGSKNPVVFDRHEVLEIESSSYLRSYSGDLITTTLLKKTQNGYQSKGISCTSRDCSSNGGCVPKADGKSCTSCLFGDCLKTVTSDNNNK